MNTVGTSFLEFIRKKGISPEAFHQALPELFSRYQKEFEAGGPNALEYNKKFFWNDLRLEFPNAKMELRE